MKNLNKKMMLAIAGLAASLLLTCPVAWSHGGAQPQHGGVVESKHDLSFELVREATGASLYVTDHDEAASVEGWSGQLTVLADGKKQRLLSKPMAAAVWSPAISKSQTVPRLH